MATFEEQLVEHRVYLMRFARLQLRNEAWAEDAVSETLLAALSKPPTATSPARPVTGVIRSKPWRRASFSRSWMPASSGCPRRSAACS